MCVYSFMQCGFPTFKCATLSISMHTCRPSTWLHTLMLHSYKVCNPQQIILMKACEVVWLGLHVCPQVTILSSFFLQLTFRKVQRQQCVHVSQVCVRHLDLCVQVSRRPVTCQGWVRVYNGGHDGNRLCWIIGIGVLCLRVKWWLDQLVTINEPIFVLHALSVVASSKTKTTAFHD